MKLKRFFYFTLLLMVSMTSLEVAAANEYKSDSIKSYDQQSNSVQVFKNSSSSVRITKEDIYFMAQVVYAESRSEPYDGKIAVASVILNRALHPDFPKSIKGVITQKGAFSCLKNGCLNVTPNPECLNAVLDALGGKDPTEDALFFYNPRISTSKWMKQINKSNIKSIGNHVFFAVTKK